VVQLIFGTEVISDQRDGNCGFMRNVANRYALVALRCKAFFGSDQNGTLFPFKSSTELITDPKVQTSMPTVRCRELYGRANSCLCAPQHKQRNPLLFLRWQYKCLVFAVGLQYIASK
jgi:hypothetical protein